ncbi:hypothetical protein [Geodermatophilus sp. SYSU D00815]
MIRTREWQLAPQPHGEPVPADVRLVELERPEPAEGQVVVRLLVMSVDPYVRGRMRPGPSYAPPWQVGETMRGGAVGRVVGSRSLRPSSTSCAGATPGRWSSGWLPDPRRPGFLDRPRRADPQVAAAAPDRVHRRRS